MIADGVSHLLHVVEIAADDAETGALLSDFFGRANEGGYLMALFECSGDEWATDATGRTQNDEFHVDSPFCQPALGLFC
jgi:hypothetical protein